MSFVKKLRRSFVSSSETPQTELDESCGFEIGCGSCKSRRFIASCLQPFASAKWALAFFSLGALFQGFIVNGNAPAVISTLEKRFELTSTESGLIASCYDIAGSATVLFVTYVGGHGHKPLWIGWGMFLVGLSGIVFSLPHFTATPHILDDSINLCANATTEECIISSLKDFRFVFYGSFILAGIGSSPLYTLTLTYLDENVKQRYSSFYNGIFIAMSILGPGIGFLVGASFLRIYTYPDQPVSIDDSHENWVGAWWMGSLIVGCLGIVASSTVLLLPRIIPGTEKHRDTRELEMHESAIEDQEDPVYGKRFRDFPKVTLQIFRNPTFVFQSLGVSIDSLLIGGMTVFGPKYIETQFGIDPSDAGIYFGILAILGGAIGQLVGGALISKYDIKIKWMMHICYISPLIAMFCSLCYLITCSNPILAGVSTLYHDSFSTLQVTSLCNVNCGCSRGIYNPVCGSDGVTYFSSCFAGCTGQVGEVYTNCTCIAATSNGPPFAVTNSATATLGLCADETCASGWQFIVFCLFTFLVIFLTFFIEPAALQVSLRCVSFKRRSFAIGIQTLMWRVLGTIPGPLVVGAIFDSACQQWTESCGTRGSCILYDNVQLSMRVLAFFMATKGMDFLLFLAGYFTYKPVPDSLPPNEDLEELGGSEMDESSSTPIKNTSNHLQNGSALPGEIITSDRDRSYTNHSFVAEITDLE